MRKYAPDDIKEMLQEIMSDPQTLRLSCKTPEEMQTTFESLTELENLNLLTEICSGLDGMSGEGRN